MSVLRPLLSRRGRLVLAAAALLLMSALVVAPSVSGAKPPASIKQYLSKISPTAVSGDTTGNSFTVTITDCGGTPLEPPCTASSTIQLGTAQILVPTRFSNVTFVSATSPDGRNWRGSWDGTYIQGFAVTGADKLNPGDSVDLTFTADVSGCETTGSFEFTTTAWGSTPTHTGETFRPLQQPTVSVNGCGVGPGEPITDPVTGQTETITGFTGHVNITFGGAGGDCGGPEFGALGDQWQVYHQATPSTLTPADDFSAGGPKVWTTEFPLSTAPGGPDADSSWYLTCYAVPQDGHTRFVSRGTATGLAVDQTVGGVLSYVGILASCADAPIPCVSEQFLTTGPTPPGPPWTPSDNRVHIAITVDPGDPHRT